MKAFLLISILVFQQSTEVNFFCNGKFYQFVLPGEDYQISSSRYTEGTFTTYKFNTGEIIVLHVGDDVVKPFLTNKDYQETEKSKNDFVVMRKGTKKGSDRFWQENMSSDKLITLYFDNVSADKLDQFEKSLNGLRITKTVR